MEVLGGRDTHLSVRIDETRKYTYAVFLPRHVPIAKWFSLRPVYVAYHPLPLPVTGSGPAK